MLLHSETVRFESGASTDAVVEALQSAAAEWRESKLSAAARAADILGWKVRIRDDRIVVRARISGRNGFLPHFVGRLGTTASGAALVGELRLSWFPRAFMLTWLSLAGGAPVFALLGPIPGAGVGEHVVAAVLMLVPAIGLFSLGLWMTRRSWVAPVTAFKEFLAQACNSSPKEHVESDARGV